MDPLLDVDPVLLDRQLGDAARTWSRWQRGLRDHASELTDALDAIRDVASRGAWQRVGEFSDAMPIKTPLLRWIYRLTEQRVNATLLCHRATQWYEVQRAVERPRRDRFTLRELLLRTLREVPRADGSWSEQWLQTLAGQAPPLVEVCTALEARRDEIASRLKLSDRLAFESPTRASLTSLARDWITATNPAYAELAARHAQNVLHAGLARQANQGWPAHLTYPRLARWFRGGALLEDVAFDPRPAPEPLGGMSFVRAIAQFSLALHDALAASDQPFSTAHDPFRLRGHTFAACLAGVLVNPSFAKRELDLGKDALERHLRSSSRALLIHSRGLAFRVLQRSELSGNAARRRDGYRELGHECFRVELDRDLYGSLWKHDIEDQAEYAGFFLAFQRSHELTEAHDLDWYRSPRAQEQLREEAALMPSTEVAEEDLTQAQRDAANWFDAALD